MLRTSVKLSNRTLSYYYRDDREVQRMRCFGGHMDCEKCR